MKYKGSRPKAKPFRKDLKPDLKVSNKGIITQNFELLYPVFKKSITGLTSDSMMTYVNTIVNSHNDFIRNLGLKFGTQHYKKICNYCILLCEGRPAEPVSRVSTGRTDKWPNCFGGLRPVFKRIIDDSLPKEQRAANMQLLLTLFKLNKVCESFMELDVEDIQKTFQIDIEFEQGFKRYLAERLKDENVDENRLNLTSFPIFGSANGPNGLPKMQSASREAKTLLSSDLAKPFIEFCELTGNESLLGYVQHHAEHLIGDDKTEAVLRKLVAIPDSGNKSRIVAICDFWTQCLLAPLEEAEEYQLKKNFSDKSAFYSHPNGFKKTAECCDETWMSIDATAWTDNFPSRLQYIYLKQRYGKALAHAWRKLAVDCQWKLGNSDLSVRYGKGQGMGTKGSFMIASITDHYVIEYIMQKHYNKVMPYCKVGDDLVVSDKDKIFMSFYPSIGVPVNLSKSKELTPKGHFLEFVSRNLWDKLDVSPISAGLITKTRKHTFLLPTLLLHIKERMSEEYSPRLGDFIDSMKLPKKEVDKLYQLVDIYQRLSGENLSFIPEGTPLYTDQQFLRIIGHILLDCGTKLSQRDNVTISEEMQEYYENLLNDQLMYELDDFSLATKHNVSLAQLKAYLFFRKLYEREQSLIEGGKYEILSLPTLWRIPMEPDRPILSDEFHKLVLELIFEVQEELNRLKIIKNLALEKWRDSAVITALFSFLNRHIKKVDQDITIDGKSIITRSLKRALSEIREKSLLSPETPVVPNSSP